MKTATKIIGSLAIVGTVAALAVLNMNNDNTEQGRFLASKDVGDEVGEAFNSFVSKHQRNFHVIGGPFYYLILGNDNLNKSMEIS